MIPEDTPESVRRILLDPKIVVPPLIWLVSEASDGISGKRLNASKWKANLDLATNIANTIEPAGWNLPSP